MKNLRKVLSLAFVLGTVVTVSAQAVAVQDSCTPALSLSAVTGFTDDVSSPAGADNAYPIVLKRFYPGAPGDVVTAFEENRTFISAEGKISLCGGGQQGAGVTLIRRVIVLRPATFIIDDQVTGASSPSHQKWLVYSYDRLAIKGHTVSTVSGNREISWETMLPQDAAWQSEIHPADGGKPQAYILSAESPTAGASRFLSVFHVGKPGDRSSAPHSEIAHEGGRWKLTVAAGNQVFHLTLPLPDEGAGDIALAERDGKVVIPDRPLAGGVLPHGPQGSKVLDLWDSDYRGAQPPIWDIGHAADELTRVIASGEIRRCRAIDLCCGSGNDAIYLASKGFDVTAMDVAPTALGQAEEKAQKAGVKVRWVLADVLAAPALEPFDFIYDRGCYHVVRDQNLSAYLETLRRYSHSGTQLLLLASKRGSHPAEDGSTGVTEEELNFDFLPLFNLEWLREYRLESNRQGATGPPAWAVLMRRKAEP